MKSLLLPLLLVFLPSICTAYDVLGIGCPAVDYMIHATDSDLEELDVSKGGWKHIDAQQLETLIENRQTYYCGTGDCCSNSIKGLAQLNVSCGLVGNIGQDGKGETIRDIFTAIGVTPLFSETRIPTSQIVCLISPDGERSFCAFTQAEAEMNEGMISPKDFENVKLVLLSGYQLKNGVLTEKAISLAKQHRALIALDLANASITERYRERLWALLPEIDLLFANADEAEALTQLPPEPAANFLKNFCRVAVVKQGAQGAWVASRRDQFHSPAVQTEALDTTGAGDLFASAFIYGYLKNLSIEKCARLGNIAGSFTISRYGATLPQELWDIIRTKAKSE